MPTAPILLVMVDDKMVNPYCSLLLLSINTYSIPILSGYGARTLLQFKKENKKKV